MGEGTTKKTPLASSPTPIRLPPPSPIPYSFPAAYLSTRHKHICKSIREHGGEGWIVDGCSHAPPNSGSGRHVFRVDFGYSTSRKLVVEDVVNSGQKMAEEALFLVK